MINPLNIARDFVGYEEMHHSYWQIIGCRNWRTRESLLFDVSSLSLLIFVRLNKLWINSHISRYPFKDLQKRFPLRIAYPRVMRPRLGKRS